MSRTIKTEEFYKIVLWGENKVAAKKKRDDSPWEIFDAEKALEILFEMYEKSFNISIGSVISKLVEDLNEDKSEGSYYYAWQSNIAMSFYDAFRNKYPDIHGLDIHKLSNEAAKNFLDMLINTNNNE